MTQIIYKQFQFVRRQWGGIRHVSVCFGEQYVWLMLLAALDALFTWLILELGGHEVNPIALAILSHGGFAGMTLFKFAMIASVVLICEYIGRRDHRTGRELAWVMVGISLLPVTVALAQLVVAYA